MKCVSCKKGIMTLEKFNRNTKRYSFNTKDTGTLVCNNCGHKEIFR